MARSPDFSPPFFGFCIQNEDEDRSLPLEAAMAVEKVLHMNAGDGQNSYANNSSPQKFGLLKAKPILDEALQDICNNHLSATITSPAECLKIADLGCSSGPNTLLFISNVIDAIGQFSQLHKHRLPEFQVFLNDLPENDFNNLFKLLPSFYGKLQQQQQNFEQPIQCFISATPGSFYGRLFPNNSLHFIHSSYGVHWLSQLPEGLENNKGNIHISKRSPPDVTEAYFKQYQKNFSTFLSSRSKEIIPGGRMVLTFVCRNAADPGDASFQLTMMSKTLLDLAAEGFVKEEDIDSFNMPVYPPYKEEVKAIVESEGSFKLNKLEVFEIKYGGDSNDDDEYRVFDKYKVARIATGTVRAFMEPLLASHFGRSIVDHIFEKYKANMSEQPSELMSDFIMVASLSRK